MHLSTAISWTLIGSVLAQAPIISINVQGQATPSGAPPAAPVGQQPQPVGVPPSPPNQQPPNGANGAPQPVVTINPGGVGAPGQAPGQVPAQPPPAPGQPQQPGQAPPGGSQAVWVVKVGSERNDLVFSPSSVQAQPGEFVQFQFYSRVCLLRIVLR